jgi:hypothetical protein
MIPARTDSRIRYEYESVCRELDKLHDKFNKVMKVQGQSQADMIYQFGNAIGFFGDTKVYEFEGATEAILKGTLLWNYEILRDVPYDSMFDEEVINILNKKLPVVSMYIERLRELEVNSKYHQPGETGLRRVFINYHLSEKPAIKADCQLEEEILKERTQMLNDPVLRNSFNKLKRALEKSPEGRVISGFMSEAKNEGLIVYLGDTIWLRRYVLAAYGYCHKDLVEKIVELQEKAKDLRDKIRGD